jgi:AraC-like DNA-binding protein
MTTSIPTSFTFDTQDFPEAERFDTWRNMMAASHDVSLPADDAASFQANFSLWHLDQMLLSHGSFSSQIFTRAGGNIRRDQVDHCALFVQGRGHRILHIGDEEKVLRRRDLLVADLAQGIRSLASEGESGTLYLPRDLVDEVIPSFHLMHGTVLRDTAAQLLAQHLFNMGRHLPQFSTATQTYLAQATKAMALACLVENINGRLATTAPVESALRRQIERYVDAHLSDEQLCAATICAAFQMSRSTLYSVFEKYSGVAGFIKQRRLLRIRSILIAGTDPRPLAEIARDYGFQTGAHFSREFRAAFGSVPSEVRASRAHGPLPPDSGIPGSSVERLFHILHA